LLWAVKDAQKKIASDKVPQVEAAMEGITSACDNVNRVIKSKFFDNKNKLFGERCTLNGDFTKELGESEWADSVRNAAVQVQLLVSNLERLSHYIKPMGAIAFDWPRALFVCVLWACIAAVFAASILLYRRAVLWDGVDRKSLGEYAIDLPEPEEWLRTPVFELNNMTPLEALRYHDLRATLFDQLKLHKPQQKPRRLKVVA
jgi:hypothetical protein